MQQERFVHQVSLRTIRQQEAAAREGLDLCFDSDGGREPAEQQTARLQDAPRIAEHGVEVSVVAREMKDGAADDEIGETVGEGHGFDGFDAKVGSG